MSALGDTILDVPQAARLLAIMLQGSPLPPATVESLAAVNRGLPGREAVPVTERLLETYSALIQSPGSRSGFTSSVASFDEQLGTGDAHSESGVSFGYAL